MVRKIKKTNALIDSCHPTSQVDPHRKFKDALCYSYESPSNLQIALKPKFRAHNNQPLHRELRGKILRWAKTNYQHVPSAFTIVPANGRFNSPQLCLTKVYRLASTITRTWLSPHFCAHHTADHSTEHKFSRVHLLYEILKNDTTWENSPARAFCIQSKCVHRADRDRNATPGWCGGEGRCRTLRDRRWLTATRYMAAYEPRSRDAEAV
jgi:hypothetical protein